MKQEEKQLLLIDLCSRLPYGVKFASFCEDMVHHSEPVILRQIYWNDDYNANEIEGDGDISTIIEFVKPYLRPMSSMTEKELNGFRKLFDKWHDKELFDYIEEGAEFSIWKHKGISPVVFDWLTKHHFDYRGLIKKGLAIEAPVDMYTNN